MESLAASSSESPERAPIRTDLRRIL